MADVGLSTESTERQITGLTGLVNSMVKSLKGAVNKLQGTHMRLCGQTPPDDTNKELEVPEPVRNEIEELRHQINLLDAEVGKCHGVAGDLDTI